MQTCLYCASFLLGRPSSQTCTLTSKVRQSSRQVGEAALAKTVPAWHLAAWQARVLVMGSGLWSIVQGRQDDMHKSKASFSPLTSSPCCRVQLLTTFSLVWVSGRDFAEKKGGTDMKHAAHFSFGMDQKLRPIELFRPRSGWLMLLWSKDAIPQLQKLPTTTSQLRLPSYSILFQTASTYSFVSSYDLGRAGPPLPILGAPRGNQDV